MEVDSVRFRMLGPLEVLCGAGWVPLGAPKMRSVLGTLLILAPGVVSVDRLVLELWGDTPPKTALTQVHGYVMRLRRLLGNDEGRVIVTVAPGYRLAVSRQDVDAQVFAELVEQGRAALGAGRAEQAAALLREGLAMWRGSALVDVPPSPLITAEANGLAEQRLAAWELRIDADLGCGRHAELIGELERLVEDEPLREQLWRQLMVALSNAGRRGAALEAFRRFRRILVEELGIEPSADVRELHQSLLADDDQAGPQPGSRPYPVPRQLPAAPRFFGRRDDLRRLDTLLDAQGEAGAATVISAITGTAGVGKTALAVHWAHRAVSRFPDGQLYVNLRGYDAGPPTAPAVALGQFLRALGIWADQIPHDTDERAALYRSLLADRRMLVVLDNASNADQVRPLLPGSPACRTVITSRDDLRALTATHGALSLQLDVLCHDDALALLTDVLGAERARADTGSLAELARLCAHLPLALRIAAANLAVHPAQPIAAHVAELRGADLLDKLVAGGDRQAAVRVAFDQSYATLREPAQRLFRLLGMAPGTDFTVHTAAALLGSASSDAAAILDQLAATHLVEPLARNRFTFHDLVRLYASTVALREDPQPAQRKALTRLLDHYLSTASAAMDRYSPGEQDRRPRLVQPRPTTVELADRDSAVAWLDAERDNLLAAAHFAAQHGWPAHTVRLAATLFAYLNGRAEWDAAATLHRQALDAAGQHADLDAHVVTLNNLGATCRRLGRHAEALEHFEEAGLLARQTGDMSSEAYSLQNIALLHGFLGHNSDAVDHLRRALELYRRSGDASGQSRALYYLGSHTRLTGRYPEALAFSEQALELAQQSGNPTLEGYALTGIGLVYLTWGRNGEAIEHFSAGLTVAKALSNPIMEAFALNNLGASYYRQQRYDQSLDRHRQALEIALRVGDRNEEFESHTGISQTLCATGDLDLALRHAQAGLSLATDLRVVHDQGRAHGCVAAIHAELGQHDRAREHWQRALAIYTELGDPEADNVSCRLAAIPG